MEASNLLSKSTAIFAPSMPPVRVSTSLSSGFFTPAPRSSFMRPSRTERAVSVLPVRKRPWKCAAVGSGIAEIGESEFEELVLKSDRPVLVEFVAKWCGPCRLISPAMEWVAQEYKERLTVVKIDHDANPKLIKDYKVYGLPFLVLFKDGQEIPESRREGAITKAKLKEYLDGLLESITVT